MFILGVIPARGNSQTIPDKNIYPLCGKPLIEYTINAAKDSNLSDYVVFTDKYFEYQTTPINRPDHMSQGKHGSVMTWLPYVILEYEKATGNHVDAVCLLQPTSPLRVRYDIDDAIHTFKVERASSLYSGYYMGIKHKNSVYSKSKPKHFQRNGAIFIAKRKLIMSGRLWNRSVIEYEMPLSRSIDIDTMDDMYIAETLLKARIT